MAMTDKILVFVTCGSREEAEAIGTAALEARLAACASVSGPVESRYWWQGEIETSHEYGLTLKTVRGCFEGLAEEIRRRHSYDTPEIVAVPIEAGHAAYLDWVAANVRSVR